MKYEVGDRVRIRRDLEKRSNFKVYVTDDMEKLAGKIVTITRAWENAGGRYEIKEDTHNYTWTEDMFENSTKPTKEELLKMSVGTIIKTDKVGNDSFIFDANYTFISLYRRDKHIKK